MHLMRQRRQLGMVYHKDHRLLTIFLNSGDSFSFSKFFFLQTLGIQNYQSINHQNRTVYLKQFPNQKAVALMILAGFGLQKLTFEVVVISRFPITICLSVFQSLRKECSLKGSDLTFLELNELNVLNLHAAFSKIRVDSEIKLCIFSSKGFLSGSLL